jgi:putative tricarboxylic transport membrane protein
MQRIIWFFGIIAVTVLVGQLIALPLFIALYLWRWGGYGWRVSVGYAAVGWAILYGYYDQVLHVVWYTQLLFR